MSTITEMMRNRDEWIHIEYNYETERYEVLKQVRGVKDDEVLKSFKREGDAHRYELKIMFKN